MDTARLPRKCHGLCTQSVRLFDSSLDKVLLWGKKSIPEYIAVRKCKLGAARWPLAGTAELFEDGGGELGLAGSLAL